MLTSATQKNAFARRVLLVDHHDLILETLAFDLRCAGSMVKVAHSDDEALGFAKTFRPELLVSKVTLPIIGDLAEAVEIKRRHPECKVVLLSFWDIAADAATTLMAGDFSFHLLCRAEHPANLLGHVAAVFHDCTTEQLAS
jgi:DNA-binding NarL/FixJ family response regulator